MSIPTNLPARVFQLAGIYGLLVLLPQYLLETGIGPDLPAPITRPEHFYGFVGVALACGSSSSCSSRATCAANGR